MKKLLGVSCLLLAATEAQAQSWNPYVNQGIVSPAPLFPAEFNGTGVLSFNVGNTGSTALPLTVNQEMTLVITLSEGIPNNVDPLAALGGTWVGMFNWSYNSSIKTYTGIQNQVIPGSSLGTITIQYQVTGNTPLSAAANGFNVNLQPPPYSNGFNTTDDDAVSSYTYVRATDYGDAPASYGSAGHEINLFKDVDGFYTNYVYMGAGVDADPANQPSATASGDDGNGTDDEDGVTFPTLTAGSQVTIPVSVTVVDGSFGTLNAWIDWNGDGDFLDSGEKIVGPRVVAASGTENITVNIPTTAITSAATFARFRFGNNTTSSGLAANSWGEVEDYQITILPIPPGAISGSVLADTNNDNLGDSGIQSVTLTLLNSNGTVYDGNPGLPGIQAVTTTTDQNGLYTFTSLAPGSYGVGETDPAGYSSVTTNTLNPVVVTAGATTSGINFVDERLSSIGGTVWDDANNSANSTFTNIFTAGESATNAGELFAILVDGSGNVLQSATVLANGTYQFSALSPAANLTIRLATVAGTNGQPAPAASLPSGWTNTSPMATASFTLSVTDLTARDFGIEQPPTADTISIASQVNPGGTVELTVPTLTGSDPEDTTVTKFIIQTLPSNGLLSYGGNPVTVGQLITSYNPALLTVDPDNGSITISFTYKSVDAAGKSSAAVSVTMPLTAPIGNISGSVLVDLGSSQDPVSGVVLTLLDTNNQPVDNPNLPGVQDYTYTTSTPGTYEFLNVPAGDYLIKKTPHAGYFALSDGDTTDATDDAANANASLTDNLIPVSIVNAETDTGNNFLEVLPSTINGTVMADLDYNGSGESPVSNVTLTLVDSNGDPIDSDPNTPLVQPLNTTTNSFGEYTFSGLPAGTYGVKETQPSGYTSLSDSDGGNPDYIQPFALAGGVTVNGKNFLEQSLKPTTWAAWQVVNTLGGANGPTDNPDGDIYDNLQEFAFCLPPNSGIHVRCPLEIVKIGNRLDAKMVTVTTTTGLTYTLEYISDLNLSGLNGAGWTPVTTIAPTSISSPDGTTVVTYANLETLPGLGSGQGFVRIKVDLATPAVTTRSDAVGWMKRTITQACETCSNPFLECELFSGLVDANTATSINITTAVGAGNLGSRLQPGRTYYVEVLNGALVGQRWNILSSTTNVITISGGTSSLTADALVGSSIIVRVAHTIGELFPPALYRAGFTPNDSDKILMYDPNSLAKWNIYYLADLTAGNLGIHWVIQGDNTLTSKDDVALDAAQGIFIHHRAAAVNTIQFGHVRQNPLAVPLSAGQNLIGSGYPVNQSYVRRGMVWTGANFNGFTGGTDPVSADSVLFWKGDTTLGLENYTTYWLVNAGFNPYRRWSVQGDNALSSQDTVRVFKATRASFYRSLNGNPNYVMPIGWTP